MTATGLQPRRLTLAAADLEQLRRLAGDLALPADFEVERRAETKPAAERRVNGFGVESAALAAAARSLSERGVLTTDPQGLVSGEPHRSVLASLHVLADPELLVETRVCGGQHTIRAAHAVAAGVGASLARMANTAVVELSLFPAEGLGNELVRMVPAVGSASHGPHRASGEVPLEALAHIGLAEQIGGAEVTRQLAVELRLSTDELAIARTFAGRASGVLHCVVTAPARRAGQRGCIGQVLWCATPGGWVGLAPHTLPDSRQTVQLIPVDPIDLGAWVAPLIAGALA